MRKKGTITVFLSLILVLLFSFLMTMLEGARVRGASAYVAMISELAGDSFLASYYYPLFQEYRLLGVDAGDAVGYFSEDGLEETLQNNVRYGISSLQGGLLSFKDAAVSVKNYKTLMSSEGAVFLSQIRKQIVLDGLSLAVTEFFTEEPFIEAGVAGQVYQRQEEAVAETAEVAKELLSLMELTDGIRTGKQGLALDKNGKLKMQDAFIKQIAPISQQELRQMFGNEEVYRAVAGKCYRADWAAEQVLSLVWEVQWLERDIAELKELLAQEEKKEKKEQDKEKKEEWKALISSYENQRDSALYLAESRYRELKNQLKAVEAILEKSLKVLESIQEKQEKSRVAVAAYEIFLQGMESSLSKELYEVFAKELETMKLYAGMEEQGYHVPNMQKCVENNLALLRGFSLQGFSKWELWRVETEMRTVSRGMESYSTEGLWFTYGKITAAEETGADILGAVGELLTTGILEMVGVSKEMQSDYSLDGEALPSTALEEESVAEDFLECMNELGQLFSNGGISEVLKLAGNTAWDVTALELYSMKYFHSFLEPSEVTKLKYEREYLVFGSEKDKTNLLYTVLHLLAIRTMLSMVGILKQADKMAEIEALAAGIAGCTGIPVLLGVIKYATILLWSVEEAFIEVAALLLGKRVPVVGAGSLSLTELLRINKSVIASKAKAFPGEAGPDYNDYLALLSLTKPAKKKLYRTMDLIQENIRYRYRDSFRIRNVVTEVEFCTTTRLKQLYDTGLLPGKLYQMEWWETCVY